MLPRCPDCGLRPRYLVDGKWSNFDKINTMTSVPTSIKVRPQHRRWCYSEESLMLHFSKSC